VESIGAPSGQRGSDEQAAMNLAAIIGKTYGLEPVEELFFFLSLLIFQLSLSLAKLLLELISFVQLE